MGFTGMNDTIFLALCVVALVLGAIQLIDDSCRNLLGWAVIALSLALLLERLA